MGVQGLYSFYRLKHRGDKKFYDSIPPLLEKKYLKTIYNCSQLLRHARQRRPGRE
jgi:hypothetical protein